MAPILGLHHVTAIAGDPQRCADFYVGALGLRMVKVTVNQDDPGTYHLYFGNERGEPGTVMTFFPWVGMPAGRVGTGQTTAVAFTAPRGSLDAWAARLRAHGAEPQPVERFGEPGLAFRDPDGLPVELVESDGGAAPWTAGTVGRDLALRGFHSVTLTEIEATMTLSTLEDAMALEPVDREDSRRRYAAESGGAGTWVDVVEAPGPRGVVQRGTVHHVAFRARDDADHAAWRERLVRHGLHVTPVIDRFYFRSIYFREPGGALFEVATDPPGFAVDEPVDHLGERLVLPPWLEPLRERIEKSLPPMRLARQERTA